MRMRLADSFKSNDLVTSQVAAYLLSHSKSCQKQTNLRFLTSCEDLIKLYGHLTILIFSTLPTVSLQCKSLVRIYMLINS